MASSLAKARLDAFTAIRAQSACGVHSGASAHALPRLQSRVPFAAFAMSLSATPCVGMALAKPDACARHCQSSARADSAVWRDCAMTCINTTAMHQLEYTRIATLCAGVRDGPHAVAIT